MNYLFYLNVQLVLFKYFNTFFTHSNQKKKNEKSVKVVV